MKKKKVFQQFGVIVIITVIGFVMIACSGKNGGGHSSGDKPNPASDFSYDLTADGQGILIKGYTGGPGNVVIPAKIEDLPVLEIGNNAFDGRSMTFSIDINKGTSSIGSQTNEKAGITAIILPDTIRKIGTSAFANTAITRLDMPDSVVELAHDSVGNSYLFSGCDQLIEIRLSDNLEILPSFMNGFRYLPLLKKVNLPKNLKLLAGIPTGGELTELIIPDTLTSVEFVAFKQGGRAEYPWPREMSDLWGFGNIGWHPAQEKYDGYSNQFTMFNGCGKLPLATRQKLKELGYKGDF